MQIEKNKKIKVAGRISSKISEDVKENSEKTCKEIFKCIKEAKNDFWQKEREARMLTLFRKASVSVPAYKDFLKKNKINPEKIKNLEDFQSVPPVSKENYLRQYPLEKLCWNGTLKKPLVFTSTSGSTGEPFYFCRSNELDWQSSIIHELFFKNDLAGTNQPTLVVICFGMGVWIGGLITYQAFEMMSLRGYPISIITPGINKEEIFKALKKLAPQFKQVILAGYPPFIKDVLDEAPLRGIKLKNLNVRLLFAAEAFTEKFRDCLAKKVGMKNEYLDNMNIYGSADIGTMAFETPLSILVRKIAVKKPKLFEDIFSPISKTPTLAQYMPSFINFEAPNREILITGDNSLPLIRYSIGDHGGVYNYNQIMEKASNHGINLFQEARNAGISHNLYQLPFVYVYERKDLSTTLYGLQVYPETIKEVLIEKPFDEYLTGKLTLVTQFNNSQNQYLEINLEMRKGIEDLHVSTKAQLLSRIVENLKTKNAEFAELFKFLQKRALPKLVFWPAEHPLHFKPGIKQKWVKKAK